MLLTSRLGLCGLCLAAVAVWSAPMSATPSVRTIETVHPDGPESSRGIGMLRLGEKKAAVEAAMGPGKPLRSGSEEGFKESAYRYRSGAIAMEVIYGEGPAELGVPDAISSISTSSPSALLFGHHLDAGLKAFERILRRRHWRIFRCDGEVFTTLLPGGPGTGISWRRGRLHEVVIDVGGSWGQQCEHG